MNQKISIADRTKALAIRIVKACTFLDEKPGVCRTLSKQLLRSGTSIGANVKEALRISSLNSYRINSHITGEQQYN
ncbi:MAG: four helix bundle protein [Nostoc sp.]